VLEAADGAIAIQMIQELRPDLVLLDISLPKIDGWSVASWIRGNQETARIPVVALTAHAYASDRAHASVIGFDEYLTKPIEPRDVFDCVQRMIGLPA
jgi:CheY-like chemotaxis protein